MAVTTNYILSELVALMTSPLRIPRPHQIVILDSISAAPWVEVVHIDAGLDKAGGDLMRRHPDKDWSLVDCSSFVVMTQRGISTALTGDRHFEQAGFVRLLKPR